MSNSKSFRNKTAINVRMGAVSLATQALVSCIVPGVVCSLWMLIGLEVRNKSVPGVTWILLLSMAILLVTPVVGYLIAGARGLVAGVVGVVSLVGHFRKPANYLSRVAIIPGTVCFIMGLFLDYLQLNW